MSLNKRGFMKKVVLLMCAVLFACSCQRMNLGPKGEGEYVIGKAEVQYNAKDLSGMKKEAFKIAKQDALKNALNVFLSSNSNMEYPKNIQDEILAKPDNYIRKAYIKHGEQRGDIYFLEARVMILVSDLATKIKNLQDSSYVKKTNIFVATRELEKDEVSLNQYCKQGIYKALKNQPYVLIDGGNLSQNNIDNTTPIVDKAKKEGTRFAIIADASANTIETASQLSTTFKPVRAKVNISAIGTNNYQLIAQNAQSASGLDADETMAYQKALSNACYEAAAQLVEPINSAINSAKTFKFIIRDVNTIQRLERLQNILRELKEVEDFVLIKYVNSNATFEVQANVSTSEEFSAKIIRKYYNNFTILNTTPDLVEMNFI